MNISRTFTKSVGYAGIIALALFSLSFLETAFASHGTYNFSTCNPPPTNQSESDACVGAISDWCNQQALSVDTPFDVPGCISSLSSDVQIIAPSAPTGGGGSEALNNPLAIDDIQDLFEAVMTAFIIISIPFIVFFIILAGFQYVTARGNPEKIKAATQALMYAIIGGVIIIGAIAITTIVGNTVNDFGAGS